MNNNNQSIEHIKKALNYYDNKEENIKHLKGYMYDSLAYRYQLARFSQADLEAQNNGTSIEKERKYAQRDIIRFIQILDEAIGEHD